MARTAYYCAALAGVLSAAPAWAAPFQNGDFSAGGAGWNTVLGLDSPGQVNFNTGSAELSTGLNADPFSAAIVQGDDGTFTFAEPVTLGPSTASLLFDATLVRILANASEPPALARDHLSVTVYDALGALPDRTYDPGVDFTVSSLSTFTLDVGAFRGRDVAVEFTLANENDGWYSTATVRNIRFADGVFNAVPEPSPLPLLGAGLAALRPRRRP